MPAIFRSAFGGRPLLRAGLLLAGLIFVACAASPWLQPYDPMLPLPGGLGPYGEPQPPSRAHLLGTDTLGRDVLSRILAGGRNTLLIGLGGLGLSLLLAVVAGVSSGYWARAVDQVVMRLTDVVMAFPAILLALCLSVVLRAKGPGQLILIIGLLTWPVAARVLRSEVMAIRGREWVLAARIAGAGEHSIIARHILPILAPSIIAFACINLAAALLLDAGLSFLGVGLPPPEPTWGGMLQESQSWVQIAPWLAIAPGAVLALLVGALNLIGYEMRSTGPSRSR